MSPYLEKYNQVLSLSRQDESLYLYKLLFDLLSNSERFPEIKGESMSKLLEIIDSKKIILYHPEKTFQDLIEISKTFRLSIESQIMHYVFVCNNLDDLEKKVSYSSFVFIYNKNGDIKKDLLLSLCKTIQKTNSMLYITAQAKKDETNIV